jgi:hypothetical protein
MPHKSVISLLAGCAVLACTAGLAAQRWGTGPFPRDGACFFTHADYMGEYFCVGTGDSHGSIPGDMNDRISSIALFGNARVAVFKDRNYSGSSTHFDYDIRDLKDEGWNDRISALRVYRAGGYSMWGRGPLPRDGACFYRDADYRGDYFCVESGAGYGAMPMAMNDRISSIRLYGRAEVLVFKDGNYSGSSRQFDRDVRNLQNQGWNDRISSVRVRSGSSAGLPVVRPPVQNPDLIVRRAYQDILERTPDDAGMRLYRGRIIDDGWSEQQVREALRNSPEYREKQRMTVDKAREIVRRAYLAVLKREPDAGSQGYVNRVLREGWSQHDVERELRRSAEYRTKNR